MKEELCNTLLLLIIWSTLLKISISQGFWYFNQFFVISFNVQLRVKCGAKVCVWFINFHGKRCLMCRTQTLFLLAVIILITLNLLCFTIFWQFLEYLTKINWNIWAFYTTGIVKSGSHRQQIYLFVFLFSFFYPLAFVFKRILLAVR